MRPSKRPSSREWLPRWAVPAGIMLIALAARLYRLQEANLWWDEALAVWAVRKGLLGVTQWTAGDVHPPLYFWSLWSWVQLFGESEFAMRLLSVFLGVLTVAGVYAVGQLVGGRRVAALSSLLAALARFHIWWSQEMRMYVLAGLAGTVSLYFFLRWLRQEREVGAAAVPRRWVGLASLAAYVIATIASLYTIFLMAALVLAQNVVVLLLVVRPEGYSRWRLFWRWVVAQLVVLAFVGIWMAVSWGQMQTWSVSEPASLRFSLQLYLTLLTSGVSVDLASYTWVTVFPLAAILVGMPQVLVAGDGQGDQQDRRVHAVTLGLAALIPPLMVYLATQPRGLFYTPHVEARYFLPFAPAFWVLLSWSVALIWRRWRAAGWIVLAGVCVLWSLFLPGYYADRFLRDELQTMVRTIQSQAEDGDAVLLDSGSRYPVFLYYYERLPDAGDRPPMIAVSTRQQVMLSAEVTEAMSAYAETYSRIWLAEVDVEQTDPERLVQSWLGDNSRQVLARRYGSNVLYLYDGEGQPPELAAAGYVPQHPLDLTLGDGGRLAGWELPVDTFVPGTTIHLSLLWEQAPAGSVKVSLQDARDMVWQSRVEPEPAQRERQRQQFDFDVLQGTPVGEYRIVIAAGDGEACLGTLHVTHTTPQPDAREPSVLLAARVGEEIMLEGYSLATAGGESLSELTGGDRLILDLYWLAENKPSVDYTVFAHLLGQAYNPATQGPVWAQHDSQPANNGYPTTHWFAGDTVVDRHVLTIDEGAPSGDYTIEVGMYTSDGQRLTIVSEAGEELGDHLVLPEMLSVSAAPGV